MAPGRWTSALTFVARHGTVLAFVSAILLALPTLNSPLLEDDTIHRAILSDRTPGLRWGPLELYDFVGAPQRPATLLRDVGVMPWFTDANLKIRFFRPLSSALLVADTRVFGNRLWASRLHSLSWFLAILWLVVLLHRRFLPPREAGLAVLIYAVSVGHVMPVAWIAARQGLIATVFALASFWLHVRRREDGWTAGRWLSPSALVIGLLAAEMALGAVALIGAWELFGRREGIRRRVLALIPYALIASIYIVVYSALGYGTRASGAYIGIDSGADGVATVVRHFFVLVGEMVAATPSDGVGAGTLNAQLIAALWGAVAALAAWSVLRFGRGCIGEQESAAMRWMPIAAAAAALPGTLALIGGRVLTLALLPSSGIVAALLLSGATAVRDGTGSRRARAAVAIAVMLLAAAHLVLAPVLRLEIGAVLTRVAVEQRDLARETPSCPGVMVIVAAADPTIATYVPASMALDRRESRGLRVLSMAPADHRIENVTNTGFDLVALRTTGKRSVWEALYRREPIPAGTRLTLPSLDVTVVEDRDGAPTRVRFDFGTPLDSPALCLMEWRGAALRSLSPPRPGQTIALPHEPGPLGF